MPTPPQKKTETYIVLQQITFNWGDEYPGSEVELDPKSAAPLVEKQALIAKADAPKTDDSAKSAPDK